MTITLSLATILAFHGFEANAQTETASTTTSADSKIKFPETTGELPRAGTPEAGAQTGDRADVQLRRNICAEGRERAKNGLQLQLSDTGDLREGAGATGKDCGKLK